MGAVALKRKNDIDLEVAADFGISRKKVAGITRAFLEHTRRYLAEGEDITLDGFGRFHVAAQTNSRRPLVESPDERAATTILVDVPLKLRVHFRKSYTFRRQLHAAYKRRETMEKYGVDERVDQEDLEKRAAEGCPKCGSKLEKHGSVLICPNHGSEPFEAPPGHSQR